MLCVSESGGTPSPILNDQPGPLSRSVKLRVSRTCNQFLLVINHSLLCDSSAAILDRTVRLVVFIDNRQKKKKEKEDK